MKVEIEIDQTSKIMGIKINGVILPLIDAELRLGINSSAELSLRLSLKKDEYELINKE
ncbi:MAG: hypothetical protein ACTSSP_11725 [Candidatus Asgardarchaeia archaeon]